MFTTIRQFDLQPGTMPATLQAIQDEFVPEITGVSGFLAYDVVDAGNRLVTISTFETEDGARESDRRSAKFVRAHPNVERAIVNRQATAGEVRVHRLADRTSASYAR